MAGVREWGWDGTCLYDRTVLLTATVGYSIVVTVHTVTTVGVPLQCAVLFSYSSYRNTRDQNTSNLQK